MKRQLICTATWIVSAFFGIALAETAPAKDMAQRPKISKPVMRYGEGGLTVHIHNLSLGELLRKLGMITRARFILNDPSIGSQSVSVSFEAQPYAEAVRLILDGFSYAIYPDDGSPLPAVTVLSTPRASINTYRNARHTPTATDHNGADDLGTGAMEHQEDGGIVPLALTEEHASEALLNGALEALAAAKTIDQDVLEQLVGAQDPRATEVLVQAASGSSDTESRAQAVEALWRHTADHAFGDETAVGSLEQLAEDADPRVSTIAHQALQDMKQFQQNNAAQ